MNIDRDSSLSTVICAGIFTAAVLALGYVLLGFLPMFLFAFGFLGGFALWLIAPAAASYDAIRIPYWVTIALFVGHKMEERVFGFFPALADITGVPVPDTGVLTALLYAFAGAWFLIPFLMKRAMSFGRYLAWTFFTAMGITELAHFFFPLFLPKPYGYFPGMATAAVLAPVAWWGMWRLWKRD